MLKVGLTGGIASGKSAVLKHFERLGAATIDSDVIAHQLIAPGQPAYQEVIDAFGEEYLRPDGSLDRQKLGEVVFSDPDSMARLNSILHPRVLERESEILRDLAGSPNAPELAVTDAALMVEVGSYQRYATLIVTYCPPDIQLGRLMQRDGLTRDEALQRISTQLSPLKKVQYADYVIVTSYTLASTQQQVEKIYLRLLQ